MVKVKEPEPNEPWERELKVLRMFHRLLERNGEPPEDEQIGAALKPPITKQAVSQAKWRLVKRGLMNPPAWSISKKGEEWL